MRPSDRFSWREVDADDYRARTRGDDEHLPLPSGNYAADAFNQHSVAWCGCCYVVSAAQMLEDRFRIALAKREGRSRVDGALDLQALLDHFEESAEDVDADWNACHGGFPLHVLQCVSEWRCPLVWTRQTPWVGHARNVRRSTAPAPFVAPAVCEYGRIAPSEVRRALVRDGPVVLEIDGEVLMTLDARGACVDLAPRPANHAVTVVGWRDEYWVVRNSWGGERVPERLPPDLSCVGRGWNACVVEWRAWRGDPLDPGFALLPMRYAPLHETDPSPWIAARVSCA